MSKSLLRIGGKFTAQYLVGKYSDQMLGDYFWNPTDDQCHDKYSELFNNFANVTKRYKSDNFNEAILLAKDNRETQQFGMILTEPVNDCNSKCMATNVENVLVCIGDNIITKAKYQVTFEKSDKLLMKTYVSDNLIRRDLQNFKTIEDIKKFSCEQEKNLIQNALNDLAFNNNAYVAKSLFGMGYSVQTTGSTFHVTKCQKVKVDIQDYHNCTKNIPAIYKGTFKFIDPISFILSDIADIIPCDPVFPMNWLIEGINYCSTPEINVCTESKPSLIKLKRNIKGLELDFSGLKARAYKQSQIEAHEKFQLSLEIRKPLISKVANTAAENIHNDGSVGNFLDFDSFNAINYVLNPIGNFFGKIWNYATNVVPFVLAFLFAIRFVSDGCRLKKQYGFGLPCFVGLLMGPIHTLPHYVDQSIKWGIRRVGLFQDHDRNYNDQPSNIV